VFESALHLQERVARKQNIVGTERVLPAHLAWNRRNTRHVSLAVNSHLIAGNRKTNEAANAYH